MNNQTIIEDYYRKHRGDLLAFVLVRLHNSDEAEDLVQEVFLRLLSGNRPINETTLPSLVYALCRNLLTDWYRHHSVCREAEHTITRLLSAHHSETAESVLSVREINEQLERGLARVPKECRELYRMHIYGDMPIRDICRETSQPYKAVEYRLGQARKQVRNQLRHVI
ncbi:MAG: sigma-70 family RNA polymerase sigma factor [Prevotella sp.]|nr:sigma-70 family RNA polymerase sigma factor [Prevotella sp.]